MGGVISVENLNEDIELGQLSIELQELEKQLPDLQAQVSSREVYLARWMPDLCRLRAKAQENATMLAKVQGDIANAQSHQRELQAKIAETAKHNQLKQKEYEEACKAKKDLIDHMTPKQISFVLQKSIEQNNTEFIELFSQKNFDVNFQNANGDSLLHTAVKFRHQSLLQKVLEKNPNLNLQDKDGNTATLLAVQIQDLVLVSKLMALSGINLHLANKDGISIFLTLQEQLFDAITSNNIEFIQKLSSIVPDYSNFSKNGKALLYEALEQHKLDIAKLFYSDSSAKEALLTAAKLSNVPVAEQLFKLKPDLVNFNEADGKKIISVALEQNQPAFIEFLTSMGANIEPISQGEYTHVSIVTELVYDNKLLNHPKLLQEAIKLFGDKALDLSDQLHESLIDRAITDNDPQILIGGLMSLLDGD